MKGALDRVLEMCTRYLEGDKNPVKLSDVAKDHFMETSRSLGSRGLRGNLRELIYPLFNFALCAHHLYIEIVMRVKCKVLEVNVIDLSLFYFQFSLLSFSLSYFKLRCICKFDSLTRSIR